MEQLHRSLIERHSWYRIWHEWDKSPLIAWLMFVAVSVWTSNFLMSEIRQVSEKNDLMAQTLSGFSADTTLAGELDVFILDNFESAQHQDVHEYVIKDSRGKAHKLDVAKLQKEQVETLKSGDKVRVQGAFNSKKQFQTTGLEVTEAATMPYEISQYSIGGVDLSAVATNERRAVTLIVNLSDMNTGATVSGVTTALYTGAPNVSEFYRDVTRNYIGFTPDTDGNGTPDVFGPFTIPSNSLTCEYGKWGSEADTLARNAGIDLSRYQHRLYIMPKVSSCSFAGVANVGCGTYCSAWSFYTIQDLIAHELGHNLGFRHAGTDPENDGTINNTYGDTSDVMGISGQPLRYFNGPNDANYGWSTQYQNKIVTATQTGEFSLAPISVDPTTTPYPQILKIPKKGSTSEYYFVSFRRAESYDANLSSSYLSGASIHRASATAGSATALLGVLSTGGTWVDPLGSGLSITQLERAPDSSYIRVGVTMDLVCTPSNPIVTLSPTSQSSDGSTPFAFSVNVTNADDACTATTFTPTLTGTTLTGSITPLSASIAPGASRLFSLTINPPTTSSRESFAVTVSDTDSVVPNHSPVSVSGSVSIDTTSPSAPTLSGTVSRQGAANLTWSAAGDNLTVTGYDVLRNGVLLITVTGTSYTDRPTESGVYTYTVRARDAANNVSPQSNSVLLNITAKRTGKPVR